MERSNVARAAARRVGLAAALVAALGSSGCLYDAQYAIRGTVKEVRDGGAEPVAGATVRTRPRAGASVDHPATSDGSGRFGVKYSYGGLAFLSWPLGGDGDPVVELTAPGFRSCTVRLRAPAGRGTVRRTICPQARSCFDLDVVLEREPGPPPDPAGATTAIGP